jgi:hypothetical protein
MGAAAVAAGVVGGHAQVDLKVQHGFTQQVALGEQEGEKVMRSKVGALGYLLRGTG